MESMKSDKKSVAGQFRFVLIKDIGDVVHGIQVGAELIENILAKMKDSRK
jgi:3-dehydroquinate synthetase